MTEKNEAARQSRSEVDHLFLRIARLRAGIWAAIEAHEAGDTWLACDILLALVDGGPDVREAA